MLAADEEGTTHAIHLRRASAQQRPPEDTLIAATAAHFRAIPVTLLTQLNLAAL